MLVLINFGKDNNICKITWKYTYSLHILPNIHCKLRGCCKPRGQVYVKFVNTFVFTLYSFLNPLLLTSQPRYFELLALNFSFVPHCLLLTFRCSLLTSHCSLSNIHSSLLTAHAVPTRKFQLLIPYNSLFIFQFPLSPLYCWIISNNCSLQQITFNFTLFTPHCFVLLTSLFLLITSHP